MEAAHALPSVASRALPHRGSPRATPIDTALVRRARRGDAEASRALYERNAAAVYGIARRMLGDDSLADDATQETWLRAFRSLERFRGDAAFSTWIHRIAVNCSIQLQRQRRRETGREAAIDGVESAVAVRCTPHLRVRLERALDLLPAGMRQVLVLHDIEGYTHEEIARLLGISAGTSKSQLSKARCRARQLLG
ncbi:MAG: RNA polymerase sigma factor [Longimicrobiales bacterium]